MSKLIFTCQKGYEHYLADELRTYNIEPRTVSEGFISAKSAEKDGNEPKNLCFPHFCMINPVLIEGTSVNSISLAIAEKFFNINKNSTIEEKWPFIVLPNVTMTGIGKRESAVKDQTNEYLRRIAGRISKLAVSKLPSAPGSHKGLVLYFEDFNKVYMSTDFIWYGQKRVSDDDVAPSRSYLKIEEAYRVMGNEPAEGQTVCDLGAAPGGWSYSAAKRGAKVTAVDNGELKAGAKNNPNITRIADDAFKFDPSYDFDWLFCDMVEHPNMVIKLLEKWVEHNRCRYFIVNLKFGRVRPMELLMSLTNNSSIIKKRSISLKIRHLFHDREELTIMGKLE